jgi:KDO2-lipid IV(A) lauroyltransferase
MTGRFFSRLALGILRAISTLPYPIVSRIGLGLGTLLWWFATPRRRITLTNLRRCLPELSEAQRRAIAREHFACFGRTFVERFIFWSGSPERIRSLVRLEGVEHWRSQTERPVILLAPHFLGLDAGGLRIQLETRFVSMYAKQKNPVLDEAMRAGRSRFNAPLLLSRQEGLRPALRALRTGIPFYLLPDMDLGPRDAVFVPFFGIPAATVTTLARVARLTGAVVVPVLTTLEAQGYVTRFDQPWEDFPGDDDTVAAARMNAYIESQVRQCPAQYLWSHKRFKTQPPGAPPVYQDN